ncbi:hypothetical protein RRG08_039490 [Elysia crispata]|uniref:Uncharacterized protein n=1 Tax=Elysia crispata TaxID=231223 RepID=A0AAE0YKM9_9GAST|nr:hypothetical protein RRG08_039490 [Elysia crispata]
MLSTSDPLLHHDNRLQIEYLSLVIHLKFLYSGNCAVQVGRSETGSAILTDGEVVACDLPERLSKCKLSS